MKNAGRLKNCLLKQGFPSDKAAEAISFFNDKIKLNYYFTFPQSVLADKKAYVTLTWEGTGKDVTLPVEDVEPSNFTFKIDGTETALRQRSDGMYYLTLDGGVFSNRLHDPHTYSVSDGTDNYTISASVLTYARSCAIKKNENESRLGKALYLYNRAAVEAFGE